ncbi:MAG: GIY-YIG nuclease family protein [Novosphingobium sp.]
MYVGAKSDLIRRVSQHRKGECSIYVADSAKTRLVYAQRHEEIEPAIAREKPVKKRRRESKLALIEADTPGWLDLWEQWYPSDVMQHPHVER